MQSARIFTQDRIALLGQLVRYGITGGLATLVNIGIYHAGIAFLALDPKLAWTLGFLGAVVTGYIIHSKWSFRGHGNRDNVGRNVFRFVLVSLISFSLNLFWVWLFVQHLRLPSWSPDPLVIGITPLLVFWLNRQWVFAE